MRDHHLSFHKEQMTGVRWSFTWESDLMEGTRFFLYTFLITDQLKNLKIENT